MAYSNPLLTEPITEEALKNYHCWENVDRVTRDPETTDFKRSARLLQSLWREARSLPIGSEPPRPKENRAQRPLGSRIDLRHAQETGANFLTSNVGRAVEHRLAHAQIHQVLDAVRLYCDLLSSMPMCFNLFGELAADLARADKAVHTWWPDTPGAVTAVEFEWSPGRSLKGEYLQNRSAFDVAFVLDLGDGTKGVIGVETKYHEHPVPMAPTTDAKMERYRTVADASGVFANGSQEAIIETELQQIWLDHLLALSMLQHPSGEWAWAKFILVHPSRNPSFAQVASEYQRLLTKQDTFGVSTIEDLLDAGVLPAELTAAFRERYIW